MSSEPDLPDDGAEVLDGYPVPAVSRPLPEAPRSVPAGRAVALAATGFVAGAATAAVVVRRRTRPAWHRRRRKGGTIGEIVGSNSFLVDVHLIRRD